MQNKQHEVKNSHKNKFNLYTALMLKFLRLFRGALAQSCND